MTLTAIELRNLCFNPFFALQQQYSPLQWQSGFLPIICMRAHTHANIHSHKHTRTHEHTHPHTPTHTHSHSHTHTTSLHVTPISHTPASSVSQTIATRDMLPATCFHMLGTCLEHACNMLTTCLEHACNMLERCLQHASTCLEHAWNMLATCLPAYLCQPHRLLSSARLPPLRNQSGHTSEQSHR